MPTAKNSPGLHAVSIKNLAGLVPGIGCRGSTWRPRISRSVMYAPVNTDGWTMGRFSASNKPWPVSLPKMPAKR